MISQVASLHQIPVCQPLIYLYWFYQNVYIYTKVYIYILTLYVL